MIADIAGVLFVIDFIYRQKLHKMIINSLSFVLHLQKLPSGGALAGLAFVGNLIN
jgi:hypothetical protein